MGDGALHDAGALDDLRQEHLALAEQIADDVHAVHQRPLDDLDGMVELLPRRLGVLLGVVGDALDQRVLQAVLYRPLAPRQVLLLGGSALVAVLLGQLQ